MKSQGRSARDDRTSPAEWYRLRPVSVLLAVAYLLVLLVEPLNIGAGTQPGITFIVSAVAAMIAAWFGWRMFGRSDRAANLLFCSVIAVAVIWTVVLSPAQRDAANETIRTTIGEQLHELTTKTRQQMTSAARQRGLGA